MGVREGELKTHLGYQTPDGWYEATLTPVTGQPDRARHLVKGPATVWIKRYILWGAGSCVSGTPLGPWDLPDCPVPDGGLYYHSAGAYLLAGIHQVAIEPAALSLQLAAAPNPVWSGDSVTFTASTADGAAMEVISWTYQPDAGGSVSPPGTCNPTRSTCKYAPQQTGMMYVKASVGPGGAVMQAARRVVVRQDTLQLVAAPTTVDPGQEATFTASSLSGASVEIISWSWAGAPVSTGSALTIAAPCATQNPCVTPIFEAGVMTVRARVRGIERTATAAATVNLCPPTGDPRLNSPEVRNGLLTLLRNSNPNAPPGGTGPGKRHERSGSIYQRSSDGSFFFLDLSDPGNTQCSSTPMPFNAPGAVRVADSHSHPSFVGDSLYGCRPDPSGRRWAQVPGDGLRVPTALPRIGGGSPLDWAAIGITGLDEYVVNKDLEVHRLTHGTPANQQASNPHKWTFRTNGSICLDP